MWAIDADHAPLYWFPRDCPRAAVWSLTGDLATSGDRLHAIESSWLDRMNRATVYSYHLPDAPFRPWEEAVDQFIANEAVTPLYVEPLDNLLDLHSTAGIELHAVPNLWPLIDWIVASGLPFSIIRKHLALPRA